MYISKEESENFVILFNGGSVKIFDRHTAQLLFSLKNLNYVYTGGIRPDEKQCFALENGKHFYVFSLAKPELIKRITLPKGYSSIDARGYYSSDCKLINIPAYRWVHTANGINGHHEHVLCKYCSDDLSLLEMKPVKHELLMRKLWPESMSEWLGGIPSPGNEQELFDAIMNNLREG